MILAEVMGAMTRLDAPSLLEQAVDAVCCVLNASDELDAVELVTNRRAAYPELLRLRACAESYGMLMTVNGGGVVLRRRASAECARQGRDA